MDSCFRRKDSKVLLATAVSGFVLRISSLGQKSFSAGFSSGFR